MTNSSTVDLRVLAEHVGETVEFEFVDGHVVRARLLSVDLDQPEELIYDVLQVIARGPAKLASVKAGTVAAADPSLLRHFRIVE
ncbi:MAG: hypothetical protein ACE5HT_17275 [Gemmatimonadales bacterium]